MGGGDLQVSWEGREHLEVRREWELAERVASSLWKLNVSQTFKPLICNMNLYKPACGGGYLALSRLLSVDHRCWLHLKLSIARNPVAQSFALGKLQHLP